MANLASVWGMPVCTLKSSEGLGIIIIRLRSTLFIVMDTLLTCLTSHLQYIHQCIAREQRAQLSLKLFRELVPVEKDEFIRPVFFHNTATSTAGGQDTVYTWDVKDLYRIKILSAKNVNVAENQKVFVRAGIYHGSEAVCSSLSTIKGATPESAEWNEILEFTLPMNEIPRASKLCFVILGANETVMAKK